MFSNEIKPFLSSAYFCDKCDYTTCKKSNMLNHYNSIKHKSMIIKLNSNEIKPKQARKFTCQNCHKDYKDYSGLWRHKKICNFTEIIVEDKKDEITEKELIVMLLKQNSQLIEQNNELTKNGVHNNSHNNTNNNSHNKTFNLQFFLNETCKDAMNIMDFVDSIKLQLSDLENVGKLGYIEGISNIITSNLKALDVTKRPVHCTDKKRETMYIKDDDKWEKENDDKNTLRKVIRKVACKNQNLIPSFKEAHPDCGKYHSKFSDQFNKIIVESMGGSGENDLEKEDKIIKNISKEVIVDK